MWQHHWHPHGACSFLVIRHQIPDRDLHEVHRLSVPKDAIQRDEVSVWQGLQTASEKRTMQTKWRRSDMSTKAPQGKTAQDHAADTGSRVAIGNWSAATKSLSAFEGCFPLVPMRAIFFVSSLQLPRLSWSRSWSKRFQNNFKPSLNLRWYGFRKTFLRN